MLPPDLHIIVVRGRSGGAQHGKTAWLWVEASSQLSDSVYVCPLRICLADLSSPDLTDPRTEPRTDPRDSTAGILPPNSFPWAPWLPVHDLAALDDRCDPSNGAVHIEQVAADHL